MRKKPQFGSKMNNPQFRKDLEKPMQTILTDSRTGKTVTIAQKASSYHSTANNKTYKIQLKTAIQTACKLNRAKGLQILIQFN